MFRKKWFRTGFLFGLFLLLACFFIPLLSSSSQKYQKEIAQNIIRFHVIANSDSQKDQALKLAVRDAVLKEMNQWVQGSESIEQTRQILTGRLKDIEAIALETLQKEGNEASVEVSMENTYFPIKMYGSLTFPAGNYEALRIRIGEAKGQNWWCVLYPPLCFLDASDARVSGSSEKLLEDSLSQGAYESLSGEPEAPLSYGKALAEDLLSGRLPVKFKLLEWLQSLFP